VKLRNGFNIKKSFAAAFENVKKHYFLELKLLKTD
jgi:hypothetical protein